MNIEANLQLAADRLSNREFDDLSVLDGWLDEAGEAFKQVLRQQLTEHTAEDTIWRMSSIGKPTCQLQMKAVGAKASRKPYNFVTQMMLGDAVEIITELLLKVAAVNVTGGKDKVSLQVADAMIRGTDDVEIDNAVYDIKSCSPWSFTNKWSKGYAGLVEDDPFGYIGQLVGYAQAKGKAPGGWIVVCKGTGRVKVVEFEGGEEEISARMKQLESTVTTIMSNAKFRRSFDPIEDKWRGKLTGLKTLCKTCEFCDYLGECWPNAEYKAHPNSEAKNPPHYWFVKDE